MLTLRSFLTGMIILMLIGVPTTGVVAQGQSPSASARDSVANVHWESMGGPPGAGRVIQLVQMTEPTHALYALTESEVYESTDKGRNWGLTPGLQDLSISSLASRGEGLITCGNGVHELRAGSLHQLLPTRCDAIGADAETIVVARGSESTADVMVKRLDEAGSWQDMSPRASDLDGLVFAPEGTASGVAVGPIVPLGDDIFAGFRIWIEGSGELDNGGLYRWDDDTASWSRVQIPASDGTVLSRLITDPKHPRQVIATFRDPMLHEVQHPISRLVFESFDRGRTWASLTDATVVSNGVTDVIRMGRARYLMDPGDRYMLRVKGSDWKTISMPTVEGIPGTLVGLETVLIDPDDPRIAYGMPGAAWELGLIKSTDRMKSWHKMDGTVVASSPTIVVSHPDDPAVVLTSGNIIQESYATRDGGKTWSPFSPTTSGDELRIDPHDPDHILLVDEMTNLFESLDGGRTFARVAREFEGAKVLDVEVAPDDAGLIYVSNLGVGISRFGVEGAEHMSNSPDYAYDIEIDPDDSGILYASNSPKKFENHSSVWRYRPDQDADFGWSEILRVEDSAGITSLRFDPADSDTMYAGVTGSEGSVWVSRDRGATWAELNPALTFTTVQGHSQLEVIPSAEDTVYVGTWGGGSFRSTDSGRTWTMLDDEHTFSPTCIEAWPADTDIVYACDRTAAKIHKSIDGGATWQEYFDFGPGHLLTTALAIDPGDPDVIYAAAFRPPTAMLGSLYRIRGGAMEADLGGELPRAVLDIAIDQEMPDSIYVTTHLHGLFASHDAGVSWRRLDDRGTGLPRTGYLDVDVDPRDSRTLYASSLCGQIPDYVIEPLRGVLSRGEPFRNIDAKAECGLYRSTDAGASWGLILETIGEAKAVEASAARPGSLYVADDAGGVWASHDDGTTWRQENEGLGTTSVTAVAAGENRLYAGTQGSGVYVGTVAADGGISWDGEDGPRSHVHRIQIEVDPQDADRLYASAYPGGVLRSDDGGRTWSAKNFLTPSIRVSDPTSQGYYAMDIDPSHPDTVWLGVYGKGLIVSRDGRDFGTFANGKDGLLRGKHITSVEVDPRDRKHVVVGAEEGVFVTTDAGRTWRRLNAGLGVKDTRALKLSATGSAPFAADFEDGSRDGFQLEPGWSVSGGRLTGKGHSWARAGSQAWTDYTLKAQVKLRRGSVHVNVRVGDEGRYFVGIGENGLYLAKSYGGWQKVKDLAAASVDVGRREHAVRVDVDGPRIRVFLDGILRIDYKDPKPLPAGAIAFESLEGSSVTVDDVRVRPEPIPSLVYAGTAGYGLYRLDESKRQWRHLGRTLGTGWWSPWDRRMYQFSSLLFDPLIEGTVYYGHFPGGFFVSQNGGHDWRDSSVGLGNDGMFSLAQHPNDPAVLFAGTYNGIVKSIDSGATWTDSSSGMPPEQWPYTVAIDDEDPDVMYVSTKNGENKGFCHRNESCGVVMKSTDGGRTWSRIMSGLDPKSEFYTLLIYPPDHDTLLLSTSRGVYASLDAGSTWLPMNAGLPSTHNQVRDNVADNLALSGDNRYLFLGLVQHGAWRADVRGLGEDAGGHSEP
ncbi:MAG: hypothetical protein U9O18_08835 [Chloroflexota bacterium]|nr:hypothetical protein [Chloroflexota bacterium]